jgi:hypothetical protein
LGALLPLVKDSLNPFGSFTPSSEGFFESFWELWFPLVLIKN